MSHVFCTKDAAPVIKSYSPELILTQFWKSHIALGEFMNGILYFCLYLYICICIHVILKRYYICDEVDWGMRREDMSQARYLLRLIDGWKDLIVLLLVQALEGIHSCWFDILLSSLSNSNLSMGTGYVHFLHNLLDFA